MVDDFLILHLLSRWAEDTLLQHQRCGGDEVCLETAVGPHEEDPGQAFFCPRWTMGVPNWWLCTCSKSLRRWLGFGIVRCVHWVTLFVGGNFSNLRGHCYVHVYCHMYGHKHRWTDRWADEWWTQRLDIRDSTDILITHTHTYIYIYLYTCKVVPPQ